MPEVQNSQFAPSIPRAILDLANELLPLPDVGGVYRREKLGNFAAEKSVLLEALKGIREDEPDAFFDQTHPELRDIDLATLLIELECAANNSSEVEQAELHRSFEEIADIVVSKFGNIDEADPENKNQVIEAINYIVAIEGDYFREYAQLSDVLNHSSGNCEGLRDYRMAVLRRVFPGLLLFVDRVISAEGGSPHTRPFFAFPYAPNDYYCIEQEGVEKFGRPPLHKDPPEFYILATFIRKHLGHDVKLGVNAKKSDLINLTGSGVRSNAIGYYPPVALPTDEEFTSSEIDPVSPITRIVDEVRSSFRHAVPIAVGLALLAIVVQFSDRILGVFKNADIERTPIEDVDDSARVAEFSKDFVQLLAEINKEYEENHPAEDEDDDVGGSDEGDDEDASVAEPPEPGDDDSEDEVSGTGPGIATDDDEVFPPEEPAQTCESKGPTSENLVWVQTVDEYIHRKVVKQRPLRRDKEELVLSPVIASQLVDKDALHYFLTMRSRFEANHLELLEDFKIPEGQHLFSIQQAYVPYEEQALRYGFAQDHGSAYFPVEPPGCSYFQTGRALLLTFHPNLEPHEAGSIVMDLRRGYMEPFMFTQPYLDTSCGTNIAYYTLHDYDACPPGVISDPYGHGLYDPTLGRIIYYDPKLNTQIPSGGYGIWGGLDYEGAR